MKELKEEELGVKVLSKDEMTEVQGGGMWSRVAPAWTTEVVWTGKSGVIDVHDLDGYR